MNKVVLCAVLSGLLACGGRVEDPTSGSSGDPVPASSSASGGSGKSGGSTDPLPSHELGACKPGFARADNPGLACNWLTDAGLCFDTNDEACSCICPSSGASVCYGPFYNGPGSATPVHCD
ncbi:MAG: hypothetical protein ABI548_05555 [Polyangiaceae bacterium]